MNRNYYIVLLILLVFFVISFLSNILGPIIPDVLDSFNLNLTLVSLLPLSFFLAYGIMSIPSGIVIVRFGVKSVLVIAFLFSFIGALTFALIPLYHVFILTLFLIGAGMAMLQVALNPLLRVAGGEEHFAFNLVLVQLVFGLASYISPLVYSYLVTHLTGGAAFDNVLLEILSLVVPKDLAWVSIYWLFAFISFVMIVLMLFLRIPEVALKDDERIGAWNTNKELLKNRTVILFFIGILAYVGSEQGVANWISKFLATYHGFDPQLAGAKAVSRFWGFFTAGTVFGLILLKIFDSRKILIGFSAAAIVVLTVSLFSPAHVSYVTFPTIGFFASSMWCIIFSLGLNSLEKHHGALSGILCTAIIGGAIVPFIIGSLGDIVGLRFGLSFLFITFAYIFSIGFWAKPLITNKTIDLMKKENVS